MVFTPPCLDCCCFFYLKSCLLFYMICMASCYGFLGCSYNARVILLKEMGEEREKKIFVTFLQFGVLFFFCPVFCAFVAERRIVLC